MFEGVSARDERQEIRAFRSVAEWRAIIRGAGFEDSMLYEMEHGDPTIDEMMCFVKPACSPPQASATLSAEDLAAEAAAPPNTVLPQAVDLVLDQIPAGFMDFIKSMLANLKAAIPGLESFARSASDSVSGAPQTYLLQVLVVYCSEASSNISACQLAYVACLRSSPTVTESFRVYAS